MKKSAMIFVMMAMASWGAQAQNLDCQSASNRMQIQLKQELSASLVTINGTEQMTGNVETSGDSTKLTVIDLEQASASILTIPNYQLADDRDFLVIEAELLGAPGTASKTDQLVCQKAR